MVLTAPPGFIVNQALEIVEFLGTTGPYVEFAPGTPTLPLRRVLHPQLQSHVFAAIEEAAKTGHAQRQSVRLLINSEPTRVNVEVRREDAAEPIRYRILFEHVHDVGRRTAGNGRKRKSAEESKGAKRRQQPAKSRESLASIEVENGERELSPHPDLEELTAKLETANAELAATNEEYRAALAASQESERRWHELAAIVESSDDAIAGQSLDGIIRSWNGGAQRLFGYTAEEVVGRHISLIIPPDRAAEEEEILRRLRAGERIKNFDSVRLRKDGGSVPVSLTISPVKDDFGRVVGASMVARDITAREQAERALRESEQRLLLALEAGRGGTWEWWIDANKVVWSPGLEAIHGLRPGTFAGTLDAFSADIHPDDRERVQSAIANVIEHGVDHHLEYRIIWPNGSVHWLEARGRLIRNDAGAPVRMVGICISITDRKLAEEAIRESEERFRLMADNAPVMIRVTEADGNSTYLNKSWYEFTGQGSEEGLRFGWLDAVHPEDRERTKKTFLAAGKKREVMQLEYRLRRSDGEYRWAIDSAAPRVGPGGEYLGYIGSVIDITDRKQIEEALREDCVRAVLETSPQAIVVVGRDGCIQLANRTAEKMFGYRREELLEQPVELLLPGDLHSIHRQHRQGFFAQPQTRLLGQGLDVFACRRDGTTLPVEISLSHIELGDDLVAVAFISDITERKQAEESLRESEERFRAAAQCGSDYIYEWDLESNALRWWGNVESSLGNRLETLKEYEERLHPDDRDKVMEAARRHLKKGEVFDEQYRIRAKDGTYRYWRDQGMVRPDVQGKSRKWIGACSDITERKQAEESLRESEARFRRLANSAPVMIWMSGTDKKCTWFNQPWLEFTGRSMKQELGDGWAEGVHPKDMDRCLSTYCEAFDARKPFTMEYRLRHADGQYRWILDSGVPQFRGTEFTGYLGSGIDITEHKRSESQLRLQAVITANMAEGIVLVRARDGVIVYANEKFGNLFGYEPGELHGEHARVLLAADRVEAEAQAQQIFDELKRGRGWTGRVQNARKDGSVFWTALNVAALEHEEYGKVWLGVQRDITERVEAELKLREELAFNAALVDTLHALVVVLDREGRIVRFNRSCQTLTGYTFEEAEGRRVLDFLIPPEEIKSVRQKCVDLHTGKGGASFENHWLTRQGERRLIRWSSVALNDDDGDVRFVICAGMDITDQRQMEETIRRNRNELRQLTTRLTARHEEEYKHLSRELHDVFSQRLTMLGMHVSDLEQKLSAAGVADEKSLGQLGEQISQLAAQIHGISRRLHPAILDDLGLAAALENECLAFSRECGIEVACHPEGPCDSVPGEIALCLYRVTQASLNNVRQHAQAARVEVQLVCTQDEILLSIEDFGKGFDPGDVRGQGGLGLVSIEERVRGVDGELTIDSAPGKGARIVARIPWKHAPCKSNVQ